MSRPDLFSAIRNPGSFYLGGNIYQDWTTPQNDALWRDEAKTLFDPCPSGWRVPRSDTDTEVANPWQSFSLTNSTWQSTGRLWSHVLSSATWYPAVGCRYRTAMLYNVSLAGHIWSSTILGTDRTTYYFRYDAQQIHRGYPEIYRAYGFSVRCVRE